MLTWSSSKSCKNGFLIPSEVCYFYDPRTLARTKWYSDVNPHELSSFTTSEARVPSYVHEPNCSTPRVCRIYLSSSVLWKAPPQSNFSITWASFGNQNLGLLAAAFLGKPRASRATHVRESPIITVILTFPGPEAAARAGVVAGGTFNKLASLKGCGRGHHGGC